MSMTRFFDSNAAFRTSPFGEWMSAERSAFVDLADDELITQIKVISESLIPTLRSVTKETGVMTEKDEMRIYGLLPNITGINDTAEFAKIGPLMDDIQKELDEHAAALMNAGFEVAPVSVQEGGGAGTTAAGLIEAMRKEAAAAAAGGGGN